MENMGVPVGPKNHGIKTARVVVGAGYVQSGSEQERGSKGERGGLLRTRLTVSTNLAK